MLLDHMPSTLPFYLRSLILVLPSEHPSYVRYRSSHRSTFLVACPLVVFLV